MFINRKIGSALTNLALACPSRDEVEIFLPPSASQSNGERTRETPSNHRSRKILDSVTFLPRKSLYLFGGALAPHSECKCDFKVRVGMKKMGGGSKSEFLCELVIGETGDVRMPHLFEHLCGIPQSSLGRIQSGYIGCNTGNGEELSSSQRQLGQATCLAAA